MRSFFAKYSGVLAALALMVTTISVNRTCMLVAHQPKLPEGAEKFRKF